MSEPRKPAGQTPWRHFGTPQGFHDVVIGESHRAFYGNQFGLTLPLFTHYGVTLWVPEVGGPLDPDNEAHDLVMSVFGGMSKGERNRIKVRVRTAMAAQTELEGRFLGGRPPYGYTLKDLGPHPNPGKAAEGKRLHGLTPDPDTAPVVQRIYGEFLHGRGLFVIAEGLTRDAIPCPSAHDRARNRHRSGVAWAKSAIRVILTNPRYTGHQIWNKQRTDEVLLDVDDVAQGHTSVMRWNPTEKWVRSATPVHEAIIDTETFDAAQALLTRKGGPREHQRHRSRNPYILKGTVYCALCDRKMQGQHSHGSVYYRCRFPVEYALANTITHPRNVILREDAVLPPLDGWLAELFAPDNRDQTIAALAEQTEHTPVDPELLRAQQTIRDADAKIGRYRAALDAGADPVLVAGWITQTQAHRAQAERHLQQHPPAPTLTALTPDEIAELLDELGDMIGVLAEADPADKAEVYQALGLRLTYHPETQTVHAQADLGVHRWDLERVRGGT